MITHRLLVFSSLLLLPVALSAANIVAFPSGELTPPYGNSTRAGHTFGYFGSSVWADDVFRFLGQHCGNSTTLPHRGPECLAARFKCSQPILLRDRQK
jgi:hypothetical protein